MFSSTLTFIILMCSWDIDLLELTYITNLSVLWLMDCYLHLPVLTRIKIRSSVVQKLNDAWMDKTIDTNCTEKLFLKLWDNRACICSIAQFWFTTKSPKQHKKKCIELQTFLYYWFFIFFKFQSWTNFEGWWVVNPWNDSEKGKGQFKKDYSRIFCIPTILVFPIKTRCIHHP